jgi:uncharacterized protein (DUF2384 family)
MTLADLVLSCVNFPCIHSYIDDLSLLTQDNMSKQDNTRSAKVIYVWMNAEKLTQDNMSKQDNTRSAKVIYVWMNARKLTQDNTRSAKVIYVWMNAGKVNTG